MQYFRDKLFSILHIQIILILEKIIFMSTKVQFSETAVFLKFMKFKCWLLCCFIKTLITWIQFSFMNWTYMQPKTRFICCFVVTLVTCITLSFMEWGYMWFETGFLCCFVVTIMTWIACTIMDCGYIIWNMLFFCKLLSA